MMTAVSKTPRALILGSGPYPFGAKGVQWESLPADLNVADYDVVVVDLSESDENLRIQVNQIERIPSLDQITRLLFSENSLLVVIGNPRTVFLKEAKFVRFDTLLPFNSDIVVESGEKITWIDDEFEYYFDSVDRYSFYTGGHATQREDGLTRVRQYHPKAQSLAIQFFPIAKTRFNLPVAWKCRIMVNGTASGEHPSSSNSLVVLPAPTTRQTSDVIRLILERKFGVAGVSDKPEWDNEIELPIERTLTEEKNRIEDQLTGLQNQLGEISGQLFEQSKFHRLLFETGTPLHDVVLQTLIALGARVIDRRQRRRLPCSRV